MGPTTCTSHQQRVLAALLHIQARLDEDLGLEELARVACFSPFHFHRIFRAATGESLGEHIRRLRLERAAQRLKLGGSPVTELAFQAGFESHEAFTRAFRSRFGCSPSSYRKRHRKDPAESPGIRIPPFGLLPEPAVPPTGDTAMNIEILQSPPLHLAFARGVGPYDRAAAQAWETLGAWAGPRGLLGPGTRTLGICHDDPEVTPPERIRYDAAIPAPAGFRPEGGIASVVLPGGTYAVMDFRGPVTGLLGAWNELAGTWLPASGRTPRDTPSFEDYLVPPGMDGTGECHVRLFLPLEE